MHLKPAARHVKSVRLLGSKAALSFLQDEGGLRIKMPVERVGNYAYVFRIEGLELK
jgi:hypothetical protein